MKRSRVLVVLVASGLAGGCSNAPLAGTLDCIFPARTNTRPNGNLPKPDDLFRPTDRDRNTLPDPEPVLPRLRRDPDTSGRLEGLPKIGEPLPTESSPVRRDANTTGDRMPLPAPSFPRDPDPPLRERN